MARCPTHAGALRGEGLIRQRRWLQGAPKIEPQVANTHASMYILTKTISIITNKSHRKDNNNNDNNENNTYSYNNNYNKSNNNNDDSTNCNNNNKYNKDEEL